MKHMVTFYSLVATNKLLRSTWLIVAGLLATLGFAPFHLPALTIICIALLFSAALENSPKQGAFKGFLFGVGYFGAGISWVIVSIHDYGQLNYVLALLTTLLFILYLSLFPTLTLLLFCTLKRTSLLFCTLLFSALWCMSELLQSRLFSGFPWLLTGYTQMDTPLRYLAPIIGIHGLSFLCIFCATCLAAGMKSKGLQRSFFLVAMVLTLILPGIIKDQRWT
jgi:apolipoprotein N-acyltransferase